MIVTDDEAIVEAAHTYRDQGKGSFLANFHTRLGANWRMSEPHAAIVPSQLGRLDEFIAARQALAKRYDAARRRSRSAPAAHPGRRALQLLQVHRVPARRHRPRRAEADAARDVRHRPVGRGLRHAAAPAARVRGVRRSAAARRGAHRRAPHLPAAVPVAHRERRRLRRRVPGDRAHRDGSALSNELIAITGGSGFVGSHVVDALLGAGYDVRVIDPKRPAQPERRVGRRRHARPGLRHRRAEGRARRLPPRGDGRRERHRRRPGRERRAQHARASPGCSRPARRADAGRVIVSSTVWVYAATHGDVVDETTLFDLETDRHLYVSEKIAAEMFCRDYATLFGRPYTVLRYGIPFGPRMRSDLVVAAFLLRAMRGEPLRIDGDGSQERRFVYVEDLAAAHVLALKPAAKNRTYNLESVGDDLDPPARGDGARSRRRRRGHVRPDPARRLPRPHRAERPRPRRARLGAAAHVRRGPAQDARLVPRAASRLVNETTRVRSRPLRAGSRWSPRTTKSRWSRSCSKSCTRSSTSSSSSTTARPTTPGPRSSSGWRRAARTAGCSIHEVNRGMSEAYLTALTELRERLGARRAARRRSRVHRRRRRPARPRRCSTSSSR